MRWLNGRAEGKRGDAVRGFALTASSPISAERQARGADPASNRVGDRRRGLLALSLPPVVGSWVCVLHAVMIRTTPGVTCFMFHACVGLRFRMTVIILQSMVGFWLRLFATDRKGGNRRRSTTTTTIKQHADEPNRCKPDEGKEKKKIRKTTMQIWGREEVEAREKRSTTWQQRHQLEKNNNKNKNNDID